MHLFPMKSEETFHAALHQDADPRGNAGRDVLECGCLVNSLNINLPDREARRPQEGRPVTTLTHTNTNTWVFFLTNVQWWVQPSYCPIYLWNLNKPSFIKKQTVGLWGPRGPRHSWHFCNSQSTITNQVNTADKRQITFLEIGLQSTIHQISDSMHENEAHSRETSGRRSTQVRYLSKSTKTTM